MKEIYARQSIEIAAPASVVWKVLTTPEFTKQYMHGCDIIFDWRIGSPLLWQGVHEGKKVVFVKGNLTAFEPEKQFNYTTFDPLSDRADVPSNYVTVTNRITPKPGGVLLEVTHGDYAKVERQTHTEAEMNEGWRAVLAQIKTIAEEQARSK